MPQRLPPRLIRALAVAMPLYAASAVHAQCPTTSSCLSPHATPGCDSAACCTTVCAVDPLCCASDWDASCVGLANTSCIGYCGAAVSGSCYSAHANPACDNAACCAAVCTADPFCCDTQWDVTCAQFAGFTCQGTPGTCGVTQASCFKAHAQGACDDVACCTAVCSVDPSCCAQSWDSICVTIATQTCVAGCAPAVEAGSVVEAEGCDERANDPCYAATGGTPQSVAINTQLRGTLGRPPSSTNGLDVDVFRVTVPDPDGDGLARVTVEFSSSPQAWAALVPAGTCVPMSASLLHLASNFCVVTTSAAQCIPAGTYSLVVAGGTYPAFGGSDITCIAGNAYTAKVVVAQNCTPCTATAPSCYLPHDSAGCNTPACCTAVCANDAFCCEQVWDATCVELAINGCLTGPPSYDTCASAAAISVGSVTLNTGRAQLELPQPSSCGAGATFTRDIWCTYLSDRTGTMELRTCGSWFDTVVAVYTGSCASPTQVACNDNVTGCPGVGSSKVTFTAQCGQRYLFRIGPKTGQGGDVAITLAAGQSNLCPNCPEDLNNSGSVDSLDIAFLLNAWGTAAADLNGDGTTSSPDMAVLLNAWGTCN